MEPNQLNLPEQNTIEGNVTINNTMVKGPFGWRIVRIFLIILFMFFCVGLNYGIALLLVGEMIFFGPVLLLFLLLCFATALLAKWITKKSFLGAPLKKVNGLIVFVLGFSVLPLFFFFKKNSIDTPLSGLSFLIVILGGLWILLHSTKFIWQEYVIVGGAVVAIYLPITVPQMQSLRADIWSQEHRAVFESLIGDVESKELCNVNIFHDVVIHEIDFTKVKASERSIVVFVVKDIAGDRGSIDLSPTFGQLPERFRATSPSEVELLIIHGEPGPYRGGSKPSQHLVVPVLLYSWPDKKMVSSGRLTIGEMGWGVTMGEAYHRIATMINQNLQITSKVRE